MSESQGPRCPESDASPVGPVLRNEKKTLFVIVLTAVTMVVEIITGRLTASMALLADGYHMGSHMAALLITYVVYRLSRSRRVRNHFTFGEGKMLSLGGFSSALLLGLVAAVMIYESVERLLLPVTISYSEAIAVAVIGLAVNLASALILFDKHHHGHAAHADGDRGDEVHHGDQNIKSAYFHVLADALTSVLAIAALALGRLLGLSRLDPVMGIVGGLVVIRWAYTLSKAAGYELLDGHARHVELGELYESAHLDGDTVLDVHVWKNTSHSTACELVVCSENRDALRKYRNLLSEKLRIDHSVVEVRRPGEDTFT